MTIYRHTQIGTLVLCLVGIPVVILVAVMARYGWHPIILVTAAFLLLCMLLMGSLTIEVTTEFVRVWFGPGLIRKRFPISEVRAARAVRAKWYHGWGIRQMPGGWLFNVSGLDAIELEMKDGGCHRIGTDRPREVQSALRAAGVETDHPA